MTQHNKHNLDKLNLKESTQGLRKTWLKLIKSNKIQINSNIKRQLKI